MEYVPGFNLDTVEGDRALTIFHPDVIKGFVPDRVPYPPPKVEGNSFLGSPDFKENPLVTLGKILGSDIIMNNSDRAPTVWLNTGNSSNIFLEVEMTPGILNRDELLFDSKGLKEINVLNMIAIDNQTNPLEPEGIREKYFHEYINSVEQFVLDMYDDMAQVRSCTSYFNLSSGKQQEGGPA